LALAGGKSYSFLQLFSTQQGQNVIIKIVSNNGQQARILLKILCLVKAQIEREPKMLKSKQLFKVRRLT